MPGRLQNRKIILGVTGGIAAYKVCTLCRLLIKEGAAVRVIMTKHARKIVSKKAFAALSGSKVRSGLFADTEQIPHITLTENADLMVIAPATANTIAKLAAGICDNLLTSTALAAACPLVVAPAMNSRMFRHPATQTNLTLLQDRRTFIIPPASGSLACGSEGEGRMAEPEHILEFICRLLNGTYERLEYDANSMLPAPGEPLEIGQTRLLPKADGAGLRVLITAGPTVEALDPVRFITNHSSGKMGYALAAAARQHGCEVTLVSGPVNLPTPVGVTRINVQSAAQMLHAVESQVREADIVIGCAAVADYRPQQAASSKQSKEECGDELQLQLVKNPDIIATVGHLESRRPYTVGFAAETDHGEEHAKEKLKRKNLDLIILNQADRPDIGPGADDNEVTVIDRDGVAARFGKTAKSQLAGDLITMILQRGRDYLRSRTDA